MMTLLFMLFSLSACCSAALPDRGAFLGEGAEALAWSSEPYSVVDGRELCLVTRSIASWNDSDSAARTVSLVAANTSGGPDSSSRATSQTRSIRAASSGSTSLTRPQRRPSSTSIQRPVSSSSIATWYGIRFGSLTDAASASVPALISGSANWAAAEA